MTQGNLMNHNFSGPLLVIVGTVFVWLLSILQEPLPHDFVLAICIILGKGILSGAGVVIGKWMIEGAKAKYDAYFQKQKDRLRITEKE